jgi:hypothetical protein
MLRKVAIATVGLAMAVSLCTSGAGAQTTDATKHRINQLLERGRAGFADRPATGTPVAAPLTKKSATDRTGDAGDPRADITDLHASYNANTVALALDLVQPTDPATDPAWTSENGFAGVEWAIETTGDNEPEYFAFLAAGVNGNLIGDVVPTTDEFFDTQVCKGAKAFFIHGTYTVTAPTACVGSAPNIWVAGAAIYVPDIEGDEFGIDFAPDTGFLGPLAGPPGGYLMSATDGGVFTFGRAAFKGSLGQVALASPIVDVAATPNIAGYVMLGADGGVFRFGNATFAGSAAGLRPTGRFVGIATTPSGKGYWLATSEGTVLSFGNAHFYGSTAGFTIGTTIVDIVATKTGLGYYLVAANGGVLAFGDAKYRGSAATLGLRSPIVAMAATRTGRGYFLIASDGGVFTYGDAKFKGSTGNLTLAAPIVGIAVSATSKGYTLVASDGGVFTYGDAKFFGSAASLGLRAPIVAIAAL